MFKTSFTKHSLWSLQRSNIYMPEESFLRALLSIITTFLLRIHSLRKVCPFTFLHLVTIGTWNIHEVENHRDVYHNHMITELPYKAKVTSWAIWGSVRQFEYNKGLRTFVKGVAWSQSWDIQLSVDREGKEFTLYVECIIRSLYTSTHCGWGWNV